MIGTGRQASHNIPLRGMLRLILWARFAGPNPKWDSVQLCRTRKDQLHTTIRQQQRSCDRRSSETQKRTKRRRKLAILDSRYYAKPLFFIRFWTKSPIFKKAKKLKLCYCITFDIQVRKSTYSNAVPDVGPMEDLTLLM